MGWFDTNPDNDIVLGRKALTYFHNASIGYPAYKGVTFDELLTTVSRNHGQIFLDGFGMAVRTIDLSDSKLESAMENLAKSSQGKIPDRNSFFSALSNEAQNLTFVDYVGAAPEIIQGTASDLVKGAQEVGNAVIDTGKSLTTIGPLLLVGAVIFIVVMKAKKYAA